MTMMKFVEMLSFMRPAGTVYEEAFIDRYIRPLNPTEDAFGNQIVDVGTSEIIWSSHTDTVHDNSGLQQLHVDRNRIVRVRFPATYKDKKSSGKSNCLGADCTTGVYIMIEMIKAGVAGRYIFHRDEESGRRGSKFIAEKTPEIVKGYKYVIAFDRKGSTDIITHQSGNRTASDKFAASFAEALGLDMKASRNGSFTDSRSYMALVPECTNIAVGYAGAHSASESQDLVFLEKLVEKMRNFDHTGLVVDRVAAEPPVTTYHGGYSGGNTWRPPTNMMQLIQQAPTSTAKLLELLGFTFETLDETIAKIQKVTNNQYDIWHDAVDDEGNKMPEVLLRPKVKKKKVAATGNQVSTHVVN